VKLKGYLNILKFPTFRTENAASLQRLTVRAVCSENETKHVNTKCVEYAV
jgi:hypothetical protein